MEELDFHVEIFLFKMISADKYTIMCIICSNYYTRDDQTALCSSGVATPSRSPHTHTAVTLGLVPELHWPAGRSEAPRPSWEGLHGAERNLQMPELDLHFLKPKWYLETELFRVSAMP